MKKILALVLVLCLFGALAACTEVTRIAIENPAEIKLEKAGGGVAVTLTDAKTVDRITDIVCQIPCRPPRIPVPTGPTGSPGWMRAAKRSPRSPWPVPRSAGRAAATTWAWAWT
jgi:hypothetical protein